MIDVKLQAKSLKTVVELYKNKKNSKKIEIAKNIPPKIFLFDLNK